LADILEPMYEATKLLSSSTFPTQGDMRLTFLGMLASLQHYKQQYYQYNIVIDAIYDKLNVNNFCPTRSTL